MSQDRTSTRSPTVYDESASGARHRALPRQAHQVRPRACPPPARLLDVGCGTGALGRRACRPGLRGDRARSLAGMLDVLARAGARGRGGAGLGDRDALRRRGVRPQPVGRDHAPHRRPRRGQALRWRRWSGWSGRAAGHRLGPQPAQPVLAVPDEAGPAGPRRRAPRSASTSCSTGSARAGPSRCRRASSGWSRTSSPRRCSAPRRRSSAPPSAPRAAPAAAPTTSSSRCRVSLIG